MKLITELHEEVKYLVEEKEGKKNYFIEGIIMKAILLIAMVVCTQVMFLKTK